MGKTTMYHPISLHVIRGAAEYCGWKFSRINRTHLDLEFDSARYTAVIEKIPKRVSGATSMIMQNDLQECFLDDIRVHWLRQTKSGKWLVDILVTLKETGEKEATL